MVLDGLKRKLKIDSLFTSSKPFVIIDTNFLLLPGSQGIDIFYLIKELIDEPVELVVVEPTIWELQTIVDGISRSRNKHGKIKGSDKFNAKLGLVLAKQKGLKVLKPSQITSFADEAILSFVKKGSYVATLDKALQNKVLAREGKVIFVKQGKRLEIKS